MTHPDELLAEYVEGALAPRDRAEVEAHLEACATCRAEVADAAEARSALLALPEVDEPPGIALDVLREARERKAAPRWGTPLRVAAAVVLIAGLAGGGIYVYGQLDRGGDADATAGDGAEGEPDAGAPAPEADDQAPEDAASEARAAGLSYPLVRRTGIDHDPESVVSLAADLRDEAGEALDAGLPADAFAFYEAFPVDSFTRVAREALVCAGQGLEPERSVVPFVIEDAAWDGEPAWVVSYLQGPEPTTPYDRVQILVVQREECRVLHFAQQRL